MIRRAHVWLLPLAGLVALAFLVSGEVAATLAPALMMAAVLLSGRMPEEALIDRWRRPTRRRRDHLRAVHRHPVALPILVRPVGGAFAAALAMRPPPHGA